MGEAKRKKEAVLNEPCPCGSAKAARECCFDGRDWHRSAKTLGLRELPRASVVDRCYMKGLKSCVAPISGEHLISESVIEILKGDGGFSISGVPWLGAGEEKILASKNFRANCLCIKHNSALSPIDDAARYFFLSLKTYLEADAGAPRHALVSGHDLERWLLKTARAMAVSGNLARGREKLPGAFAQDDAVIGMLDDPGMWPASTGLYCLMHTGDLMVNHSRFQLLPWTNEQDEIVALQVSILGFIFVLLLEPLDIVKYPMLADAKYRPARITIAHPKSNSWLTLSWQEDQLHEALNVRFVKAVPKEIERLK